MIGSKVNWETKNLSLMQLIIFTVITNTVA
jgi:hypothetical protein